MNKNTQNAKHTTVYNGSESPNNHACRHVMKQIFGKHIGQQLPRSKRIIAAIQLFLGNLQQCSGNAAAW